MAVGYALSTQWGQELLRQECEAQLARALRGEVRIERVRFSLSGGLGLVGGPIVVSYPGEGPGSLDAMSARRAAARIDVFAMLTGRLRLHTLRLEDYELKLGRDRASHWQPPFAEAIAHGPQEPPQLAPGEVDYERATALLRASEGTLRRLLAKPLLAGSVEIVQGRILFSDRKPSARGAKPLKLRFDASEAWLDHRRPDADAKLVIHGVLQDERGRSARLEIHGERNDDDYQLEVAAPSFDLALLRPYAAQRDERSSLAGTLSGRYALHTSQPDHAEVALDLEVAKLVGALPLGRRSLRLDTPRTKLDLQIEMHPGRLRLSHARIGGTELTLALRGSAERPLHAGSQARFAAELLDAGIPQLRRAVAALPEAEARKLLRSLDALESGRIARFGVEGATTLSAWSDIATGEVEQLPSNFAMTARVRDVALEAGRGGQLTDIEAVLEWVGDMMRLRDVQGLWNGEPTAVLTLTVDGVNSLLAVPKAARALESAASPLPGLPALWEVLTSAPDDGSPPPSISLALDHFDHPLLAGPLRGAMIDATPHEKGMDVALRAARWAGIPVEGEARYASGTPRRVEATLRAGDAARTRDGGGERGGRKAVLPGKRETRWASGWLKAKRLGGPFQMEELRSAIAIDGSTLHLVDARASLAPNGHFEATLSANLADPERVALEVEGALTEGELRVIGPACGLPPELVSGRVDASAWLAGPLIPGQPIHASLRGSVKLQASDGRVYRGVPMLAAIAHASEGFNPFAAADEVRFDRIEAALSLDRGRISTENFELDGPLRVFASGKIDLRREPHSVDAVVGLFILRQADQLLGNVPLVKWVVPGRDRGLLGAYFDISGELAAPEVDTMAAKSIAAPIADVLTAPFRALDSVRSFLVGEGSRSGSSRPAPRSPGPASPTPGAPAP